MELEAERLNRESPKLGCVGFKLRDDGLVCDIRRGTPAEISLSVNDMIKAVDGVSLEGMSITDIADLIKGPLGSIVSLHVLRPDKGILSVNVTRTLLGKVLPLAEPPPEYIFTLSLIHI